MKAGDKAWVVLPVSSGWETLKFTIKPVQRLEPTFAVIEVAGSDGAKKEAFVPGAFTNPALPSDKLETDSPVMVAHAGGSSIGRVAAAPAQNQVKVRFRFAGVLEEKEVPVEDVLKLDGTLTFGAPVAYSEEKEEGGKRRMLWRPAQLVQSAEDKCWLVTTAGRPIRAPLSSVKALNLGVLHKTGDKVWAGRGEELMPGQVLDAQDGATRYKIKLDEGSEITASFEVVTSPIK